MRGHRRYPAGMQNAIKAFLESRMPPRESPGVADASERVRIAACALLLELAHADNELSATRSTAPTRDYMAGRREVTSIVMQVVGHSDPRTTMTYYRFMPEHLRVLVADGQASCKWLHRQGLAERHACLPLPLVAHRCRPDWIGIWTD